MHIFSYSTAITIILNTLNLNQMIEATNCSVWRKGISLFTLLLWCGFDGNRYILDQNLHFSIIIICRMSRINRWSVPDGSCTQVFWIRCSLIIYIVILIAEFKYKDCNRPEKWYLIYCPVEAGRCICNYVNYTITGSNTGLSKPMLAHCWLNAWEQI